MSTVPVLLLRTNGEIHLYECPFYPHDSEEGPIGPAGLEPKLEAILKLVDYDTIDLVHLGHSCIVVDDNGLLHSEPPLMNYLATGMAFGAGKACVLVGDAIVWGTIARVMADTLSLVVEPIPEPTEIVRKLSLEDDLSEG